MGKRKMRGVSPRKRSMPLFLGLVIAASLVGAGFVAGMLAVGGVRQVLEWNDPAARATQINQQRAMSTIRVLFAVFWRSAALVGVGAAGLRGVEYLGKLANTIYPDAAGIFPVVRVRTGPVVTLHDINRQVASAISYSRAKDAGQIAIVSTDSEGQFPVTMGALAVQHAAAAHRWPVASGRAPSDPEAPESPPVPEIGVDAHPWPERVNLLELLDDQVSIEHLVLGVTIDEEQRLQRVVRAPMSSLVHVAVGGSSGFGKSVFLRALTYQLVLAKEKPQLVLIDLEGVTLVPFATSPNVLYPVADTEVEAEAVLRHLAEDELNRRKQLFAEYPGVDSLQLYNEQSGAKLPPIVTIIDEGTALLSDGGVESSLRTLAQRARKYGLWVILAGQDWKASSLDSAIKNQLSSTVQFRAKSSTQSRVLLGVSGAEKLPTDPKGRALAQLPGRGLIEMQTPYIGRTQIARAVIGDGPARAMPSSPHDRVLAERVGRVMRLHNEGRTDTAIAREVFGYGNNFYIGKVRQILQQQQQ